MSVHHVDARAFVERAAAQGPRYDVIMVRTGEPSTLLANRLHTREFLLKARASLHDGGIFVSSATLAEGYLMGEVGRYAGDMYGTMRSVFDDVLVTPDVTAVFFGSVGKGTLASDAAALSDRFLRRGVRSDLYPALFRSAFPLERTREMSAALAALPRDRVNTDWRPTTYVSSLALWARYSGSRLAGLLLKAADAPRAVVFAVLAALAAAGALLGLRARGASVAPVAVLYTGAAAMSMTVVLIYAFQVEYGYVYNWIGVLVGAFVAGLAVGGLAGNAAGARRLVLADSLVAAMPLAMLALLSAAPAVVGPDAGRFVILALAVAAGFATGFEFPVAAAVLQRRGTQARDAGGVLEAADHLGACVGAMLTGVMVVPALGIWWTLALLAAAKAATLAVVLISDRGR
jgi:spermidine synthase